MADVTTVREERTLVVTIDRPHVRNAVDGPTARVLADAFRQFDADDAVDVAVLQGAGGSFCSGADLTAIAHEPHRANTIEPSGDAPMGPTRMQLTKPVIAAVEGHAVAGGLELALWCDLRVAGEGATFGFLNRRWGVPLIDGGTVRLQRIVGLGRALDLILSGRVIDASEAASMGLVNRVVPDGSALETALALAAQLASLPQTALRGDRRSALEAFHEARALENELRVGMETISAGGVQAGARRFTDGSEEGPR